MACAFASIYAWGWVLSNSPRSEASASDRSVPLCFATWLIRPPAAADFGGPAFAFLCFYFLLLPVLAIVRAFGYRSRHELDDGDFYSLAAPDTPGEYIIVKVRGATNTEIFADELMRGAVRRRAFRPHEFYVMSRQFVFARSEFAHRNPRFLWNGSPSFWTTSSRRGSSWLRGGKNYPGKYAAIEQASERIGSLEGNGEADTH
jgi:hypothetical protein